MSFSFVTTLNAAGIIRYSFVAEVHYSSQRFLFFRENNNSVAGRCTGARIKGRLFCIIVEPYTDGVIKK